MVVEPLSAMHVERLRVQARQRWEFALWPQGALEELLRSGQAFAGVRGEAVLAVAGVARVWEGRYQAWALLSGEVGPSGFLAVHRVVRAFLDQCAYPRIEATVEEGFEEGHRWVRLLGMRCETPDGMPAYYPTGARAFLYARPGGRFEGVSDVGD